MPVADKVGCLLMDSVKGNLFLFNTGMTSLYALFHPSSTMGSVTYRT